MKIIGPLNHHAGITESTLNYTHVTRHTNMHTNAREHTHVSRDTHVYTFARAHTYTHTQRNATHTFTKRIK